MKKVPILPNMITALGLSCGLFVIFRMTMAGRGETTYHDMVMVVSILMLAGVADLLDGAVARALKAESAFGGIFDSLADAISFGVAPTVMVLKSLSIAQGTELSYLVTTAAMVFSVCGVLRLVRFSCQSVEETDPLQVVAQRKNFTGLPIPAAAAALISLNLFLLSPEFQYLIMLSDEARGFVVSGAELILGYLMISRWKFFSIKTLHVRVATFQMVFLTAMVAVFIFYGIAYHFSVVLFVVSWAYVITAMIFSIIRVVGGSQIKTLEDFEPDPDELE